MTNPYQICTTTIMDTTADPDITFDASGESNYVKSYNNFIQKRIPESNQRRNLLEKTVSKIKQAGKGKEYDCIIGVSGGVDSTYTAYYAKKILGLRPLAVHMDNGWNSELAVSNIEKTLKVLDIELHTEVLDWKTFRNIQLAFLKASTPDGEVPTDHAIWGVLYRVAAKYNIKYIISGTNARTEGILPRSWAQGHIDTRYMYDVNRRFGNSSLKLFPVLSVWHLFYYIFLKRIKKMNLLDFIDYSKTEAMHILKTDLDWKYYGGKHYESVYTRFYQGFLLPTKFSIDKRRAHLSALICAKEITREEALQEISKSPYPEPQLLVADKMFIMKKLNLDEKEFERILNLPIKKYADYKNMKGIISKALAVYQYLFSKTNHNS